LATFSSIDLRIAERLKDREFRRHWFRAILENNVPEQFRDLREARNMTQTELAVAADMKQSAISRFESQRVANWKLETLLKMADALDAQLEILVIPAEQIIARHEHEEAGVGWQSTSVVEVRSGTGRGFNDVARGRISRISALSKTETLPPFNPGQEPSKTAHAVFPMSAAVARSQRQIPLE
jgi:transcriptional regulator with XRE-family HTH domain